MADLTKHRPAPPTPGPDAGDKAAAEVQGEAAATRALGLAKANTVRLAQADLRARLKARKLDDLELIRGNIGGEDQAVADNMRLGPFLRACPGVAEARMQQILEAFVASPRMRLGRLSFERRVHLAKVVRGAREIDV